MNSSLPSFALGSTPPLFAGPGTLDKIRDSPVNQGRSPLLFTDKGLSSTGIALDAAERLGATAIVDTIPANPTLDDVERLFQVLKEAGPAATVVALGGGSVLDATKAACLVATNGDSPYDFAQAAVVDGNGRIDPDSLRPLRVPTVPALPWIAVPTTSGTGSETNGSAVLINSSTSRKTYLSHELAKPALIVLDPTLTVSLPRHPTACCGADALTHAIEAYTSTAHHPYADAYALHAVRLLGRSLPAVIVDGTDVEGRAQVQLAAHLAGLAFSAGPKLGLVHAMGHPVSARLNQMHGQTLASVLPTVMQFNEPVVADRYAELAFAAGVADGKGARDSNGGLGGAKAFIAWTSELLEQIGVARGLNELGGNAKLIPLLAADAIADRVILTTPRLPTVQQVEHLYEEALTWK